MSVNRWNPMQDMVTLRDAMDRLFQESYVRAPQANSGTNGRYHLIPPVDAWETEDEIFLELALPGVDPESVDVTYEQDSVLITGQFEAPAENRTWLIRERARGPFQRRFSLNVPVNVDKAEATFHNGLLQLRLPKSEAIKPRKIAVRTAS